MDAAAVDTLLVGIDKPPLMMTRLTVTKAPYGSGDESVARGAAGPNEFDLPDDQLRLLPGTATCWQNTRLSGSWQSRNR